MKLDGGEMIIIDLDDDIKPWKKEIKSNQIRTFMQTKDYQSLKLMIISITTQ